MSKPKGKHAWTAKVGEKGQIVIPQEARKLFDINPGDTLLLLGDEKKGIAIVKNDIMQKFAAFILNPEESVDDE
jgi:AbrB family looped-hinge helix DNA binding protein